MNENLFKSVNTATLPSILPNKVQSSGSIIFEDDFKNGTNGWVQLFTPPNLLGTFSRIFRGTPRISIRTPNVASVNSMGIKRLGRYYGEGKYLLEFLVDIEYVNLDPTRPRWYGWGIDTCDSSGNRSYFYLRYLNYDESVSASAFKFQLQINGGSYVDIPGGNFTWPVNENKALPIYIAIEVDILNKAYRGVNINNAIKVGSLANVPNSTITALGMPPQSSLSSFSNGLNPFFDLVNRSNAGSTRSAHSVHWSRLTYLGA